MVRSVCFDLVLILFCFDLPVVCHGEVFNFKGTLLKLRIVKCFEIRWPKTSHTRCFKTQRLGLSKHLGHILHHTWRRFVAWTVLSKNMFFASLGPRKHVVWKTSSSFICNAKSGHPSFPILDKRLIYDLWAKNLKRSQSDVRTCRNLHVVRVLLGSFRISLESCVVSVVFRDGSTHAIEHQITIDLGSFQCLPVTINPLNIQIVSPQNLRQNLKTDGFKNHAFWPCWARQLRHRKGAAVFSSEPIQHWKTMKNIDHHGGWHELYQFRSPLSYRACFHLGHRQTTGLKTKKSWDWIPCSTLAWFVSL